MVSRGGDYLSQACGTVARRSLPTHVSYFSPLAAPPRDLLVSGYACYSSRARLAASCEVPSSYWPFLPAVHVGRRCSGLTALRNSLDRCPFRLPDSHRGGIRDHTTSPHSRGCVRGAYRRNEYVRGYTPRPHSCDCRLYLSEGTTDFWAELLGMATGSRY